MTYSNWSVENTAKRAAIIRRLKDSGLTDSDLVNYFDYANMSKVEPAYCELYTTGTKCHNTDELNCFFCGCPYFVYDEQGISTTAKTTRYSFCKINAIKGKDFTTKGSVHLDCSECEVPHKTLFTARMATKYIEEATND